MPNRDLSQSPQSTTTPIVHLAAALQELEETLTQRPASGTGYLLRNIETWVSHRDRPFLQLEILQQGTLKARLISILDPRRIGLAEPVSPHNGETQGGANARTRAKALDILIAIDGQQAEWWKENTSGFTPPVNTVCAAVLELFSAYAVDLETLQAYHPSLMKWPRFMESVGRFYGETLSTLSMHAAWQGLDKTVAWINETAKPDLARANVLSRAGGAKPARTPGG